MQTILVTGACGWIGRRVCSALQAKGCYVLAADLREASGPWNAFLPLDITGPFPDTDTLLALTGGNMPSAVIHCAGLAHQPVETPELKERFFAVNAAGTRNLLSACREWGISRFVYLSSIAFYDWSQPQPLTEQAPVSPNSAYAASKLEGEQEVLQSGLDGRVARLATVYGEGDPANFAKLARALKRRRFLLPGHGSALKSVIPVDLAAQCLAEMALAEGFPHPVINLGLSTAPSLGEICGLFSKHCAFPAPKSLPLPLFQLLASAGNLVTKLRPGFPLNTVNLRKLTTSTSVNCGKAVECFPCLSETTFESGLQKAALYYQSV